MNEVAASNHDLSLKLAGTDALTLEGATKKRADAMR
jgi:hypothetical protein